MKKYRGIVWVFVTISVLLIIGYLILNQNARAIVLNIKFISDAEIELSNGNIPEDLTLFADDYKGYGDDIYISKLFFKRIDCAKNVYDELQFEVEKIEETNRHEAENIYNKIDNIPPTYQMTCASEINQAAIKDTIGGVYYYLYLNKKREKYTKEKTAIVIKKEIENALKTKNYKAHSTRELFILILNDTTSRPGFFNYSENPVVSQPTTSSTKTIDNVNVHNNPDNNQKESQIENTVKQNTDAVPVVSRPTIPASNLQRPSKKSNLITWNSELNQLAKKITIYIYCNDCKIDPTEVDVTDQSSFDFSLSDPNVPTTLFDVKLVVEFSDERIKQRVYYLKDQIFKCKS